MWRRMLFYGVPQIASMGLVIALGYVQRWHIVSVPWWAFWLALVHMGSVLALAGGSWRKGWEQAHYFHKPFVAPVVREQTNEG